ncbi:MAG: hypothetical protein QME74_07700 [Candidatus Edwardsbacteria bacterium]|nr:hypothetical protein [Candidatus Edwardsbacteria bacterium]
MRRSRSCLAIANGLPIAVIKKLAQHPLTDIDIKKFLDDWARAKK